MCVTELVECPEAFDRCSNKTNFAEGFNALKCFPIVIIVILDRSVVQNEVSFHLIDWNECFLCKCRDWRICCCRFAFIVVRINDRFGNKASSFGRIRQGAALKCVVHEQHDNFSAFELDKMAYPLKMTFPGLATMKTNNDSFRNFLCLLGQHFNSGGEFFCFCFCFSYILSPVWNLRVPLPAENFVLRNRVITWLQLFKRWIALSTG